MAAPKIPGYLQKKTHMRAVLLLWAAVFVFLALLLLAFALQLRAAQRASLTTQSSSAEVAAVASVVADAEELDGSTPQQSVFAPNLVALLGLDENAALAQLGHGAQLTKTEYVYDSTGARYQQRTITLSSEPADKLAGTPSGYLTLDDDGLVIEAGYRAGMAYLGYGSLSFVDAVENAQVIETTLTEAGLAVETGSAVMPQDRSLYSTYASDGVTLTAEQYEFSGTASGHPWRAVIGYDYSTANSTGNLVNTIRVITVYVGA